MGKTRLAAGAVCLCLLSAACSPREVLTRRLAADLIAGSRAFRTPQQFWLRTGVVSNKDFLSPEYVVLQHSGWISGTSNRRCPAELSPPPCWDVVLTPLGVETFRDLIHSSDADKQYFSVATARRELVVIAGISRTGNMADVDFIWKWKPLNEVGAALYAGDIQYSSTVRLKNYDDGWRLVQGVASKPNQDIEDALKNAEPVQ